MKIKILFGLVTLLFAASSYASIKRFNMNCTLDEIVVERDTSGRNRLENLLNDVKSRYANVQLYNDGLNEIFPMNKMVHPWSHGWSYIDELSSYGTLSSKGSLGVKTVGSLDSFDVYLEFTDEELQLGIINDVISAVAYYTCKSNR